MLQEEGTLGMRLNSPSYSDNSSLGSGCAVDDMEDFELFPDLKEFATRQVSSDTSVSEENIGNSNKRNIVAVRLDPGNEKDLIDYLLGKSDNDRSRSRVSMQSKSNDELLETMHQNGQAIRAQNSFQAENIVRLTKFNCIPETYGDLNGRDHEGKLCMSKNAVAARENRLRKKQYINDLEQSVKSLTSENRNLKNQVTNMHQTVGDLRTEVRYLRSVLANQSTLSALLKNIPTVPGINFTASAVKDNRRSKVGEKRSRGDESDEENIDSNIQRRQTDSVFEEGIADNLTRADAQTTSMCTRGRMAKIPKLDHSYATNNPTATQYQKRMQEKSQERKNSDDTGAGVCLHVSGNKVSLEFCPQCSRRASTEEEGS